MIEVGEKYQHFKGKRYKVLMIVRDSNDCTKKVVIYESLDDTDYPKGTVWSRLLSEFDDVHPKHKVKRFTEIK